MESAILEAREVRKHFPIGRGALRPGAESVKAVDGVSLSMLPGETLGVVGESGCGKSTLARVLLGLIPPTDGEVFFKGGSITGLSKGEWRAIRRQLQIVFQDPFNSLDPRMKIGDIVAEGLKAHGMRDREERRSRVRSILDRVGLRPELVNRFPHELSGGQRQRIGIARALVLEPLVVIADEPVSALDVSVQAQVLNLLIELKQDFDLTYLLIAHDLSVVGYMSDRIAVMYLGKVVEVGPASSVFSNTLHPYTMGLLAAIPEPRVTPGERFVIEGDVPDPKDPPSGCRFRTRCPLAEPICADVEPPLEHKADADDGHMAACHFAGTPITGSTSPMAARD